MPDYAISHFMPTLFVDDLEAAIEFWGRMGWAESFRYPDDGPTTHAGVCSGECSLMLGAIEDPARVASIPRQSVYTFVENVDAYHAHCRAVFEEHGEALRAAGLGRAALGALEDQAYGMRDFDLVDPWGHSLCFGEGKDRVEARQKVSS